METIISRSEKRTLEIAKKLAKELKKKASQGVCICLYGELGAGKTTFTKGFATGLGLPSRSVKSPTFTLVRKYKIGSIQLNHCDFYRITDPDDLLAEDFEEMMEHPESITLVEWPERITSLLPSRRLEIHFTQTGPTTRTLTIIEKT